MTTPKPTETDLPQYIGISPCPFCERGRPSIAAIYGTRERSGQLIADNRVECICGTRGPSVEDDSAIDAWNTRTDTTRAKLEAAEAKLAFLASKGLTVGMLKDGHGERLAYLIEPESELCDIQYIRKVINAEARATAAEARCGELYKCFLMGTPYPLHQILQHLVTAADHLFDGHSCDHHGYEVWMQARDHARVLQPIIEHVASSPSPAAQAVEKFSVGSMNGENTYWRGSKVISKEEFMLATTSTPSPGMNEETATKEA